eukprot:384868_1
MFTKKQQYNAMLSSLPFNRRKAIFYEGLDRMNAKYEGEIDKIFGKGHQSVSCSIVTQELFYRKRKFSNLTDLDHNLLQKMQHRAHLLHNTWGRGSFIIQCSHDHQNQRSPLKSFFDGNIVYEFVEEFVKMDKLFKLNDYVIWMPLKAINVLFSHWYHLKLLNDTSLYWYILDLGFHIYFISNTILLPFYVMGASKLTNNNIKLHKSLKKYFNHKKWAKAINKSKIFSTNKIKKLLSHNTFNALTNHKHRNEILPELIMHYFTYHSSKLYWKRVVLPPKSPYSVQDFANKNFRISVCYDKNIHKCKLLNLLNVIHNKQHIELAKPIIDSIHKSDFTRFVLNGRVTDGFDDMYSCMAKEAAIQSLKERNMVKDDVDILYGFWIVNKMKKLTKILKSSFTYYAKKLNDKDYNGNIDSFQHIRILILRQQLWGDRICAYCQRYGKTKLCCGCYSVWYCNQKCQKLAWLSHRTVCKDCSSFYENIEFLGINFVG